MVYIYHLYLLKHLQIMTMKIDVADNVSIHNIHNIYELTTSEEILT